MRKVKICESATITYGKYIEHFFYHKRLTSNTKSIKKLCTAGNRKSIWCTPRKIILSFSLIKSKILPVLMQGYIDFH